MGFAVCSLRIVSSNSVVKLEIAGHVRYRRSIVPLSSPKRSSASDDSIRVVSTAVSARLVPQVQLICSLLAEQQGVFPYLVPNVA
jgi:hypothetical protein